MGAAFASGYCGFLAGGVFSPYVDSVDLDSVPSLAFVVDS